jgi:hypothetical protein
MLYRNDSDDTTTVLEADLSGSSSRRGISGREAWKQLAGIKRKIRL